MLAKRKMLLVRFELKLAIFWLLSCTKNESINRNISKFSCLLVQAAIVQLITITDIVSISHSNPMHIVSLNGSIWTRERERERRALWLVGEHLIWSSCDLFFTTFTSHNGPAGSHGFLLCLSLVRCPSKLCAGAALYYSQNENYIFCIYCLERCV